MAITTNDGKLAIMELEEHWTEGLPLDATDPFTQGEKQHFIWGFPEVLWPPLVPPVIVPNRWNRIALTMGLGL